MSINPSEREVQLWNPQATAAQLEARLAAAFPRYRLTRRGGTVIIGDGAANGVAVKVTANGQVKLPWACPSAGVQLALNLSILLTGVLPGLILLGVVYLSLKGRLEHLRAEVGAALSVGASPTPSPSGVAAHGGTAARFDPGPFLPMAAGAAAVLGVSGLASSHGRSLLWILMAVGAFLIHEGDKTGQKGTGRVVLGVGALLKGLSMLPFVAPFAGLWGAWSLLSMLFFLALGGLSLAAHVKEASVPPFALVAAGAVLAVSGLVDGYDFYDQLVRFGFDPRTLTLLLSALLHLVLAYAAYGRARVVGALPAPHATTTAGTSASAHG